jgi:hypothetical protein
MTLAPREGTFFWSNGYAWGICTLARTKEGINVELAVSRGELALGRFVLDGFGYNHFDKALQIKAGKKAEFQVSRERS